MLFYDFEVFKYDWLVVVIDMMKKKEHVIINDPDALKKLYEENKNEIWVGFNSRHYDQYILKGILCGFDPKRINDYIIVKGNPGWRFSSLLRNVRLINYDVMTGIDRGLKTFEGFMGNDIRESSVPFDIDRKLTQEEIEETVKYCRHDVEQTVEVFLKRSEEFDATRELIKIFNLPITSYSKTKAQLVCEICGGMGKKFDDNEFDFPIVPCVQEHLKKYRYVLDWYKNPENHDYSKSLETIVAGVPHTFAWGGVHGAKKQNTESGVLLNMDVTAYYPSIQIQYKFGYRNMSKPENFELIHRENLRYKAEGNKKARLPFKIADNSMSGQLKDKNSKLYDPMMNNAVCVNGQLMLLLLIEMIEPHVQLVQSNTDGLLVKLKTIDDFDLMDDIVYEWECLTGMKMEFELFNKVFQKDVNNYILIGDDGKIKSKGGYVKKLSDLDYDLPIVNKALINYMVHGISVEDTILPCDDLKEFQMVTKISNKYKHIVHGNRILKEKCIRVFASKAPSDAGVFKVSIRTGKPEKISNSPENCFIYNNTVNGVKVPNKLDKQFYIDMAIKRLKDFGVV
jgi:DNA polymerase elongation subunit (family B)